MNEILKAFFSLSNNEQRGIISLALIILFVFIGPRIYILSLPPQEVPQDNTHLIAQWKHVPSSAEEKAIVDSKPEPLLFSFDPNHASKEDLLKLGIPNYIASTLINYRSKGGRFYEAIDLLKIYGITPEEYERLSPYINIPKKEWVSVSNKTETSWEVKEKPRYTAKETPLFEAVDINLADSAQFTLVKGIGPVYASRIVKYRKLLGGYHKKEQLLEVYGIDEEVYAGISNQLIITSQTNPIKVNSASWLELKSHPYISGDLANIILNYIKAHGQINDLTALRENQLINEETLIKINPYLSFQE